MNFMFPQPALSQMSKVLILAALRSPPFLRRVLYQKPERLKVIPELLDSQFWQTKGGTRRFIVNSYKETIILSFPNLERVALEKLGERARSIAPTFSPKKTRNDISAALSFLTNRKLDGEKIERGQVRRILVEEKKKKKTKEIQKFSIINLSLFQQLIFPTSLYPKLALLFSSKLPPKLSTSTPLKSKPRENAIFTTQNIPVPAQIIFIHASQTEHFPQAPFAPQKDIITPPSLSFARCLQQGDLQAIAISRR